MITYAQGNRRMVKDAPSSRRSHRAWHNRRNLTHLRGNEEWEVNTDHNGPPPPNKSSPIAADVLSRTPRSQSD